MMDNVFYIHPGTMNTLMRKIESKIFGREITKNNGKSFDISDDINEIKRFITFYKSFVQHAKDTTGYLSTKKIA